ncbi:hypothetical protein GQ53DRAFT_287408 [Thozetella sp. PMI_491]|nr:hypothetical protein GQ53DRAFT_287408 [Thozetella sp. PMI_491]
MEDNGDKADQMVDSANTPKAAKDKKCPFCGQAFTSSSLGRHLDLYIKEKNPKPPDGVHDVDAIRKLRGNITRRQPRRSLRRETSTPAHTPSALSKRSPASDDAESSRMKSPTSAKFSDVMGRQFPFNTPWEATGVINDITAKAASEAGRSEGDGAAGDGGKTLAPSQRAVSRQMMKAQLDMKQKIQDAADTARAAELALREMMSAWRAAKQHIDMHSMPFDFEPLSLDFPALCLQCLEPPPTLFSSTQHPTATSWSILPPGEKQFEALKRYFNNEFARWRVTCAAATTAYAEDLTYPPSNSVYKSDFIKEAVHKAEKAADVLESQVGEHIESMFSVWQALPEQQRQEFWVLELARGVGRKQKEVDTLKQTQHSLTQENANLKTQIEHLNRLQQPREFKIMAPATIPMPRNVVDFFQSQGVVERKTGVGMNMEDRHSDLNTLVSTAIERWKQVIVATRMGSGLQAQRPLATPTAEQTEPGADDGGQTGQEETGAAETPKPATQAQTQPLLPTLQTPQPQRSAATNVVNGAANSNSESMSSANSPGTDNCEPASGPPAGTTSAPESVSADADEEMSDQDADGDAEMDDDADYASIQTPTAGNPSKTGPQPNVTAVPTQRTEGLEVPRTRGIGQQRLATGGTRSMTQVGPGARGSAVNGTRSATMQGVGGGDPMFVD